MMNPMIEKFNQFLHDGKIKSINTAAKAMDLSASALSQFLNGKYRGKVEEVEKKVSNFVNLLMERELTACDEITFIEGLRNTQLILDITRLTHVRRTFGLITGRAGYGKSLALESYRRKYSEVIHIEADGAYNAKELLKEISLSCGFNGVGHLNKLKKEIISKLDGSGRMIVVDQAEYLPDKGLDLLRTIHDKAKIGVVLCGLPILLSNIKGIDGIHEQVYTRIGASLQLEPPTTDDLKKLIHTYVDCDSEVDNAFITECRRNPRVLYILIREAKRIAKNKNIPVNSEIVKKAGKQLVK